jgi:hypothetical protein
MDEVTKNKISVHHIIPRSRGGENTKKNTIKITRWIHRRWHDLFREMTPEEAIEWIKTVMVAGEDWQRKKLDKLYQNLLKSQIK